MRNIDEPTQDGDPYHKLIYSVANILHLTPKLLLLIGIFHNRRPISIPPSHRVCFKVQDSSSYDRDIGGKKGLL